MSAHPVLADSMSLYMAEVRRFPLLSVEDEKALGLKVYEHGDKEAARTLVTSNLRFVVKIAYEYRHYGLNMIDLIQEGNIGLMKAVSKFDPHRGFRLISYAVWWIRAYIQAHILKSWSLVKIGTTQAQRKLFYKLKKTKREMTSTDGDAPSHEALALALGVTEADIDEMDVRLAGRDFFLDTKVDSDGGTTTHLDLLPAASPSQEEEFEVSESAGNLKQLAAEAMKGLTEKERYVVEERVMSDDPMTLQEIGDHFSISRERARQIVANAIRKVKKYLAGRKIETKAEALVAG
jgi:RNA polymerase sigma-32 factor